MSVEKLMQSLTNTLRAEILYFGLYLSSWHFFIVDYLSKYIKYFMLKKIIFKEAIAHLLEGSQRWN